MRSGLFLLLFDELDEFADPAIIARLSAGAEQAGRLLARKLVDLRAVFIQVELSESPAESAGRNSAAWHSDRARRLRLVCNGPSAGSHEAWCVLNDA